MDILEIHRLRLLRLMDECAAIDRDLQKLKLEVEKELTQLHVAQGLST